MNLEVTTGAGVGHIANERLDHLRQGRETYARREWHVAYHALLRADEATPLEADDLERLSTAAYLTGREVEFQQVIERLHRVHLEADHAERAARCTFWLALSFLFRGDVGQSNAWTARGQRLIQDRDCVERGYLLVAAATHQLRDGDAESAQKTATEAAAIGERCHDADLTAAARHLQGKALLRQGQVVPGLKLLDETMLAVVASELSPIMTGLMYCSVIEACRHCLRAPSRPRVDVRIVAVVRAAIRDGGIHRCVPRASRGDPAVPRGVA